MKKGKIKQLTFILILFIGFTIFLFLMFKSYNYEKTYTINKYKIKEVYNKETGYYTFLITYNNKIYPYELKSDYLRKRNLITDVNIYEKEDNLCLLPKSTKLDFYPVCSNDTEIISYNLTDKDSDYFHYPEYKNNNKEYEKIKGFIK